MADGICIFGADFFPKERGYFLGSGDVEREAFVGVKHGVDSTLDGFVRAE